MPARRVVQVNGLRFKVSPGYWLRRWTRFPFFFESHNASFRIDITRVAESQEPWPSIPFEVEFADGRSIRAVSLPLPALEINQHVRVDTEQIYIPFPGQTHLRIPSAGLQFRLYSYHVRREEALWIAVLSPLLLILIGAITLGGSVLGAYIERGGQPTINNIITLPTAVTPSTLDTSGSQTQSTVEQSP